MGEKEKEREGEEERKIDKVQAYPMDPAKTKEFGLQSDPRDMHIIDTPDFCNEEQASEVATRINDFLVTYKFEIICILYAFSATD